ncbi:hypothetical protein PGT21_032980 [Puccinia graminis f. sp. tritici]|uniref:Uncharacterized protein n=1 Tax=Puccinia graminis f. sp. tritici TaxID=56615 RepID=A0A5B0M1W0_PUCGR|nr:hypothetical protein PGT21_032980 [Puccinia graminis f. sp. tritici]
MSSLITITEISGRMPDLQNTVPNPDPAFRVARSHRMCGVRIGTLAVPGHSSLTPAPRFRVGRVKHRQAPLAERPSSRGPPGPLERGDGV